MKDYSFIYQRLFFAVFWVVAAFGFISDELIPPLQSMRSMVFLAADALWIVLACCTVRNKWHIGAIAAGVVLMWVSTCAVNQMSSIFWLNGMRDFVGIMCAYPVMCYFMGDAARRRRFEPSLDRCLMWFLVLQALCITYQFLRYGANDHGGGVFGNWFSGQASMSIYLASFYLVYRRIDTERFVESLIENKLPILLLFPTFLNETKVSFVLLAAYFLLLIPLDRRFIARIMWIVPVAALLIGSAVAVYLGVVRNTNDDDVFSEEYLTEYVLTDVDEAEGGAQWEMEHGATPDVPRVTKILYLPLLHEQEPGHEWLGWGVGQFKGGTVMEISDFAYRYDWLLYGTIPYVFHVHIQLGILGVLFVVMWFVFMFLVKPSWAAGRNINMHCYALLCVLLIMGYNDTLRNMCMCIFIFAMLAAGWQPAEDDDVDESDNHTNLQQQ